MYTNHGWQPIASCYVIWALKLLVSIPTGWREEIKLHDKCHGYLQSEITSLFLKTDIKKGPRENFEFGLGYRECPP